MLIPPSFVSWQHEGKLITQVNNAYKYALLVQAMEQYDLRTMVETGTYHGDTIGFFRHHMNMVYSIEKYFPYYTNACQRFQGCSNIVLIEGDSGEELPRLIPNLNDKVLFWLDAHGEDVSNPNDYRGPIQAELEAIYCSNLKGVILVDDMDYLQEILPTDPRWPQEYLNGVVRMVNV